MGGMGSGRPKTRERDLVEDCDIIDIVPIAKYRWSLYPILGEIKKKDGKKYLSINYNKYWFGPRLDLIEYIEIVETYPFFGGKRLWLKCPCGRRVRKIYSPPNKTHFRCRTNCYHLTYKSQESNVYDGLRRKMAKAYGLTPKKYEKMVFGN